MSSADNNGAITPNNKRKNNKQKKTKAQRIQRFKTIQAIRVEAFLINF